MFFDGGGELQVGITGNNDRGTVSAAKPTLDDNQNRHGDSTTFFRAKSHFPPAGPNTWGRQPVSAASSRLLLLLLRTLVAFYDVHTE